MYEYSRKKKTNMLVPALGLLLYLISCQFISSAQSTWTKSGDVYQTTFNNVLFKVDANLAGRIISFQLDGQEILGQPDLHPEMFGSTFWPAPQSKWRWPPYPALDVEPFSAEVSTNTLILESKTCPQSGLKFIKKFVPQPEKNRILIEYIILNPSDSIIEVAPWEVTRVPSNGLTFFPQGESAPQIKSTLQNVEIENGIIWYFGKTDNFFGGQKMFVSGSEGWLAHCYKNMLFIKQIPDIKDGECAPGQGEIEIFANGKNNYIELENHGKHKKLGPGEKIIYPVFWYLNEIPKSINIETGNSALVEEVKKTIEQEL